MDLYEFNLLPLDQKAQHTWEKGIFLASIEHEAVHLNLYWVDKFYSEVHFDMNINSISAVKSFKSISRLERFLDFIKLPFDSI